MKNLSVKALCLVIAAVFLLSACGQENADGGHSGYNPAESGKLSHGAT